MKRNKLCRSIGILVLCLAFSLLTACSNSQPVFKGFYQSEMVNGETVQLSVFTDDSTFIEFISNRIVNQGTYTKVEEGKYHLDGDTCDFDVELSEDNSFEIIVPKLNDGEVILMKNIDDVPATFGTDWDDIEEYKDMLK